MWRQQCKDCAADGFQNLHGGCPEISNKFALLQTNIEAESKQIQLKPTEIQLLPDFRRHVCSRFPVAGVVWLLFAVWILGGLVWLQIMLISTVLSRFWGQNDPQRARVMLKRLQWIEKNTNYHHIADMARERSEMATQMIKQGWTDQELANIARNGAKWSKMGQNGWKAAGMGRNEILNLMTVSKCSYHVHLELVGPS